MFIVLLTYQKPLAEIDRLMSKHVAWLKGHYASGLFIASGRRVPRSGGVILARSGNADALRAAMLDDPFVAHDAATFEIVEFTPSMTAPGAEVFKLL
ncbi:hypothetical protein HLB44_09795 [Aquincola sp. S2]|uniref:YCII-related domain-containing protein n=1 Tax=Pseudaquabacterium terrae TaxID=2732868 RepID=A0ABX2EF64_9BURK|nr:YciI family protein [Aquabacterium terrae]NRF67275.1 hypothetical protein [Aquabacterium terrae]